MGFFGHRKRLQSDRYSLCLKSLCILHIFANNSEHQQLIVLAFLSFQIGSPREVSLWFHTQMKINICIFVRNYTSRIQVHLSPIQRSDVKILKNQDMKIMCEYQMTFLRKVPRLSPYCLSIDFSEVMVSVH